MSLFGNFSLGVNALQGHSAALQAISNNISNSSTVGYKTEKVQFQEFVSANEYPASLPHSEQRGHMHGIDAFRYRYIDQQGNIANTGRGLDLSINGRGFFTTTSDLDATGRTADAATRFSRDGNFVKSIEYPNPNDLTVGDLYLTNKSGNYLMGFPVSPDGTITERLEPVSIRLDQNEAELAGRATENIRYEAILPSQAEPGEVINDGTLIYDGGDTPVAFNVNWIKGENPNEWSLQLGLNDDLTTVDDITFIDSPAGSVQAAAGQVNMPSPSTIEVALSNGQTINLDISNTAQYATDFIAGEVVQDGYESGDLVDLSFNESGYLVGNFSNGVSEELYRLPITYFTNDNGLSPAEGNDYARTQAAGEMSYYFAEGVTEDGTTALGGLIPESLENSTTDIANEFTGLIQTQRAYQMATKIITAADEMTRTAVDTKR